MIIIGIVGSPAGGKSTVAGILERLGCTWIHADQIAKSVLNEASVQQKLIDYFGANIQASDGVIDRSKLASAVFGDDDEKRKSLTYLESVIHPETKIRIAQEITQAQRASCPMIALEVPLLFESSWDLVCDEIWCVDATRNRREQWARRRNWNPEELQKRESNQLPINIKKRLSNLVIINDGDLEQLNATVTKRWSTLSKGAIIETSEHCLKLSSTT